MTCQNPRTRAKYVCSRPSSAFRWIASAAIRALEKPARRITSPRTLTARYPTLVEDDFVLWESPAILKYLVAKHPERKLAGTDAKQAAQIDQWLFWWGCG